MAATPEESIASLRLLIAVAKADGVLHEREREALEESMAEVEMAAGLDQDLALGLLLGENPELDAIVGEIRGDEARLQAYAAAYALAHADGDCSAQEREVLERVRRAFEISAGRQEYLERVYEPRAAVVKIPQERSSGSTAFEGLERQAKIDVETRKTAVVCALLGAFPLPLISIATDLAVVGLQIALARDIATFWGKPMDTDKIKGMLTGFGVGSGARIAVTNLLKVFPGWGSAAGAAAAYASTYAVGKVMNTYFEREDIDSAELKNAFHQARSEGKAAFEADKSEIEEKAATSRSHLERLGQRLQAGEISQAEFEREAGKLG